MWRSIDITDRRSFDKVKVYLEDYYKWEDTLQIEYLEKLADGGLKLNVDSVSYLCYVNLGMHYRDLDSLTLALKHLTLAEEYAHDTYTEHEIYNNLGMLYEKFQDYNTALDYYFLSVEKGIELGDGSECYPIGNISALYQTLEDYQNAIKYIQLSLEKSTTFFKKPDLQYSRLFDYGYWIANLVELNHLDSLPELMAIIHDNMDDLEGVEGERFSTARYVGYYSLSNASSELGKIDQAYSYLKEAKKHAHGYFSNPLDFLKAKIEFKEKKYQSALKILRTLEDKDLFEMNDDVIKLQKECYTAMNNFQKVIEINEKYIETLKSNNRHNQSKYITLANAKFELYEKNQKISKLQDDQTIKNLTISNQWNLLLLSVLLFSFLSGLLLFLWNRNKQKKELNQHLQRLVDQKTANLQKANEELKMFNYIASHDLKEPLTTIMSYIGILKKEVDPQSKQLQFFFDIINTSIKQSRHLLEDIMAFWESYEDNQIVLESINLNELISNITKSIDHYIKQNNAHIEVGVLPQVNSNAAILYSVFKNVIENGIKFNTSKTPQLNIQHYSTDKNYIIISIEDNGIGIEKKYQKEIFKSFKRLNLKSEFSGSALGLSITKNLIQKLNGRISVESELQKGSTFYIQLPILDSAS